MIRILFFIETLSGGGAEKVLCNLVNNMDQSKFDITVQTVWPVVPEQYLKKGVHYRSIFRPTGALSRRIENLWYRICTALKLTYPLYIKDDYDIEVAYLECGPTKVMAASTNRKAKKIAWVHCDVKKKGLTAEKSGKYYTKFDQVVCVSREAQASFDEVFGKYAESTLLYNVIDEEEIEQNLQSGKRPDWDKDKTHLLCVGRLSYEKGCDRMIPVCQKLKECGYAFQLHFLGDGPERELLEKAVAKSGLSEYVRFEGFSPNPYPYMDRADLIVIPSRTEALSTVAIESLILGKAVVTTPCAGMRELFGSSEFGVIAKDTPDGLFSCISEILESDNRRKRIEDTSLRRGTEFRKGRTIEKTQELFQNL